MQYKMIAYYRVSTDKQGRSGLGLEAQETAVAEHVRSHGCNLIASYTEVETGKRDDLDNRPELRKAIAHAKRTKAILVVAKLDRLSRSVAVTSLLHQSGVEFVCCDNATANRLTIQILAAVAEDEARRISERTKAALAAYKARGGRLGASLPQCRNLTSEGRHKGALAAAESHRKSASEAYESLQDWIKAQRRSGKSFGTIAKALNESGEVTRRGKLWNPMQVKRVFERA